jgi:hypothetical protein
MLPLLNKRIIIAAGIIIMIFLLAGSGYYFYNKGIQDSTIPLQPIKKVDFYSVKQAQQLSNKYISDSDTKEVVHSIEKAKTKPPTFQYTTASQSESDKKANYLSNKDKADYILKETESDNNIIQNNYYAIKQDKKNRIGGGIAVINNDIYGTIHYQRDRLRIEAFKSITNPKGKNLDGAAISYDFVKF